MAKILPFQGLRYNAKYASEIHRLITPPYDIISPKDQGRFYRSHPFNVIRLEYGKIQKGDSEYRNRYTRARRSLEQWLAEKVLVFESKPAFYMLQTDYPDPVNGGWKTFTGLFGRVRLEPLDGGKILPHEKTYSAPKADRLSLLEQTGVSFSPVFSLYRDPSHVITGPLEQVRRRTPVLNFEDWSGCRHRLWVITHPAIMEGIEKGFQGKKLLIADGHHRYSTALNYRERYGGELGEAANYVMMCLAETNDPGLSVLPVYRLIQNVSAEQWKYFEHRVSDYFEVIPVEKPANLRSAQYDLAKKTRSTVIGFLTEGGKKALLLKVKTCGAELFHDPDLMRHSRIYCQLDVVILNHLILDQLLHIRPGEETGRVTFNKDHCEAHKAVFTGAVQAAFLPGLPNLNAIWDLAKSGETMPQKSTYFLPKIITGLVLNPISLDL